MVLPRSLVAAGWPGLAYKEGPEDPPEGVSKRITFEHVYTNLALENCTMIWRRVTGCTDESTNQKSPNFKRKITLKTAKKLIWYINFMNMYSNHFFFQNLLKLLSQSPQNDKFYFPNFNYTLLPYHPMQFDKNILQFEFYTHLIWTHAATWSSQVKGRRQDHFPFSRPHTPTIRPASTCQDP